MTTNEFAAAVGVMIDDDLAIKRASMKDLAVVSGVLGAILENVNKELERREQARAG